MKCQNCGERESVIHLTKILNGEKKEYDLCESCAQDLNAFSINQPFDVHKFFSGLLDTNTSFSTNQQHIKELECPFCKMKYSTFKRLGKVGCEQCYDAFGEHVSPLIRRIHGSEEHKGKIPQHTTKEIKVKREIENLKNELQRAIEKEEYEVAAKLRDEIKTKKEELL
jgi:protein arginine kinase activator